MNIAPRSYTKSQALNERARNCMAGGVSSEFRKFSHPCPVFYEKGAGSHLWDVDGNELLDFTLSQGPLILGHSHPHVLQKVADYSAEGQLFAGQHLMELELAEKLQSIIPCAELMRFCLSGSEADHAAFRLARAYTGKQKILRFEGHYHGWFDNVALGLGAKDVSELGSRENPDVPLWSEGLPDRIKEEIILRPWNDLDLVKATVEKHHHEIAAIVTEPVMCNSGCIAPKPGFLEGLRELCDQYGIVLIFDEVITGFRLSMGGAQARFGITPDLGIFGKAMASGYPISALVGKASIMKLISEGRVIHAGTMNSNNPCIAAAMATIEILEGEKTHDKLYSLGLRLMEGIREAARATGQNLRVQGMGPMFHTGFSHLETSVDYRDTLALDKAKGAKFVAGLQNRGVRIIGRGLWYISNAHTEAEIDQAIATVHTVLREDF